ncbi:MAG: hypothetical protein LUO80_12600, partial [Methylococcaceae bacterium]|nr:hypothetical protein [Methylococcaceae bacterium]
MKASKIHKMGRKGGPAEHAFVPPLTAIIHGMPILLALLVLLFFPEAELFAHERWILTPEQIQEWNSKPTPALWSSLRFMNV